jgi:REP element-mobilizing transposase RayT
MRAVAVGCLHHITQRENYQQHVFEVEKDYTQYLQWLKEYSQRYFLKIWPIVL